MRGIIVGCLAATVLIAGCSRHDRVQSDTASIATPSPSIFTRPHPKAGLWRTSVSTNAGPGFSMTGELCLDASNEDAAFSSNGHGFSKDCGPIQYQTADRGFGFTTVCHLGRRTVTTSGIATGDFKNNYSVDLTTRTDPAPAGFPAQMSTTIRAKWQGPCPAGQKPGQMSLKISGFGAG